VRRGRVLAADAAVVAAKGVVAAVEMRDVAAEKVAAAVRGWRLLETGVMVVVVESEDPSVARDFRRARLASVSRGTELGMRLPRIGRALNSRRLRSSSSWARSRASWSSRFLREMASPGSSKVDRVSGLLDLKCGLDGE
jgi:hypothetical protein